MLFVDTTLTDVSEDFVRTCGEVTNLAQRMTGTNVVDTSLILLVITKSQLESGRAPPV
ncbi:MAG: hypothetical protein ACTSYL_04525 [Candidatus Thorarchaeota archaeon]